MKIYMRAVQFTVNFAFKYHIEINCRLFKVQWFKPKIFKKGANTLYGYIKTIRSAQIWLSLTTFELKNVDTKRGNQLKRGICTVFVHL